MTLYNPRRIRRERAETISAGDLDLNEIINIAGFGDVYPSSMYEDAQEYAQVIAYRGGYYRARDSLYHDAADHFHQDEAHRLETTKNWIELNEAESVYEEVVSNTCGGSVYGETDITTVYDQSVTGKKKKSVISLAEYRKKKSIASTTASTTKSRSKASTARSRSRASTSSWCDSSSDDEDVTVAGADYKTEYPESRTHASSSSSGDSHMCQKQDY